MSVKKDTQKFVPINLSREQWGQLRDALEDAFPDWDDLAILVKEQLGENMAKVSSPRKGLSANVFDLIQWVQARGLGGNLVEAARLTRPGNPKLEPVAAELLEGDIVVSHGADAPRALTGPKLESIVCQELNFEDAGVWWQAMGEILPRVCLIDVDLGTRARRGTGFLVGRSAVLTNYHVVAELIDAAGAHNKIGCIFDYQRVRGAAPETNKSTLFTLADDWLIDSSEPSPLDKKSDWGNEEPSPDQLDYVLMRLAKPVAEMRLGDSRDEHTPKRGYIPIKGAAAPPGPGSPLHIVQHPAGRPLQLALDTQAILWTKETRLRYRTNTLEGSSGAPCFDAQWNAVALHHVGDPAETPGARFNQGIPLKAIVALLQRRKKDGELGSDASNPSS